MKKLFLFLCLIVLSCGYLSATNTVTLHFDSKLKCQLTDWDDYDLPPAIPPLKKYSLHNNYNTSAYINVYTNEGIVIYQINTIVYPNSQLSINTNNWNPGSYTLRVRLSNGTTSTFAINCK